MATPGYECSLFLTGSATVFTTEAFTDLGGGDVWQITSVPRRIWNGLVIPSFFDNGVAIPTGDIDAIDYLFGTVTFTGVKTGPITATGSYLPSLAITESHEFSLDLTRDMADTTVFGDLAHRRTPLLLDASGEINVYDTVDTDYDPGGGTRTIYDLITNETPVVFTFALNTAKTNLYRALGIITGFELTADVAGIQDGTISWQSQPRTDAAGRPVHFGYQDL